MTKTDKRRKKKRRKKLEEKLKRKQEERRWTIFMITLWVLVACGVAALVIWVGLHAAIPTAIVLPFCLIMTHETFKPGAWGREPDIH